MLDVDQVADHDAAPAAVVFGDEDAVVAHGYCGEHCLAELMG